LKKCRLNIRIKQVDMEQDGTTKKCFVFWHDENRENNFAYGALSPSFNRQKTDIKPVTLAGKAPCNYEEPWNAWSSTEERLRNKVDVQ
jgi:hypothetical protein